MSPILPKQCVLVVDDSPENIDLLSEILRDDYRVRVATSGEKALKIVYSDEPPDLILLDIMMPGISGLEICRRLKANPDRRRIPIIFVTAMSSTEDERRGLEIGAVDYITKPISPPIVMAGCAPTSPSTTSRANWPTWWRSGQPNCSPPASRSSVAWAVPPSSRTTKPATTCCA
jgi:CheY-like chemotaxis protein